MHHGRPLSSHHMQSKLQPRRWHHWSEHCCRPLYCPSNSTAPQHSIAEDHCTCFGWRRVACQWRKTNWKKQKKTSQSPLTSVGQMEGMADGMAPSSATQLAKARAPFRACQAKQQRSRTQSCTGSLFCLPGEAATHLASAAVIKHDWIVKQQNAVLHRRLIALWDRVMR